MTALHPPDVSLPSMSRSLFALKTSSIPLALLPNPKIATHPVLRAPPLGLPQAESLLAVETCRLMDEGLQALCTNM